MAKSRNISLIILLFIFTSELNAQASVDYLVDVVKRLKIPHAEFKNTPLREALDFLRNKSAELNVTEPDPTKKGFNIVLYTGKGVDEIDDIPITLELDNVSFDVAFRQIAAFTKMKYVVENHAVIIAPHNWKVPKRTKGANFENVTKHMIIPSLDFSNTSLHEALDFLRDISVELNYTEKVPAKKRIKVICQPDPRRSIEEVKITMKLRNVPLSCALEYTAAMAGMQCEIESGAVYLVPIADKQKD